MSKLTSKLLLSPRTLGIQALVGLLTAAVTGICQTSTPPEDWRGSLPVEHWFVGVKSEYATSADSQVRPLDSLRLGVGVTYRAHSLDSHISALVSPTSGGYESFSGLVSGGLRSRFSVGGLQWSYGVAVHSELRLLDHAWLAYATPLEVGTLLFERGTLRVQLLTGLRRVATSKLVDWLVVDPNGFDDETARDNLSHLSDHHPWQAFVALDFSRLL